MVAERAFVTQRLGRVNVAFDDEVGVGQNGFQFGQNVFKPRPTWRKKFRSPANSFQSNRPRAQSKQNAPSTTKLSLATRNREIEIHIQSTAIRNRAIAADNRATRIFIRATAAVSREIGIYSQEIATYIREIAADIQEMAVNIGEIGIDSPRTAACRRERAANVRVWIATLNKSMSYEYHAWRRRRVEVFRDASRQLRTFNPG